MRILVTGAAGHIGSRLIRDLPSALPGSHIILVDNLTTQRYPSLFELPVDGRYSFVSEDIVSADLLPLLKGVDVVIHLAAITDAEASVNRPEEVETVNLQGLVRVADACLDAGCALFFPSTTSVYGPQGETVDESCGDEELSPQSPYADSKLRAEAHLREMAERGLQCFIGRLGTIYGTSVGMRFHTAVNKFCWQAAMGMPITVWRTALHQRRPYLDLGDAVSGIVRIIRDGLFDGETYNLVTENRTVHEIIGLLSETVQDLSVEYVDSEIMNQLSYTVSREKAEAKGFRFEGDIGQGIRSTLEILRQARSA